MHRNTRAGAAAHAARLATVGLFSFSALLPGAALAGPMEPVFDWATIGAPGNRATIDAETPFYPGMNGGSVPYRYRMTRTEVTAAQWLGFVNDFWPYYEGANLSLPELTGGPIAAKNYFPGVMTS
jgi:hypothetical protein